MEQRKEIKELQARWLQLPSFKARDVLLSFEHSPFGKTPDGLWDFRALPIEGAVHKVEIAAVDLAYSRMGVTGQLGGAFKAVACRFDGCVYESNINGVFERCSFIAAKLARSTIREAFVDCDFSRAALSRVRGSDVSFRGCSFASVNLSKACLYDSRFVECVFRDVLLGGGSLAGSAFKSCQLVGVDWKNTILDGVTGIG